MILALGTRLGEIATQQYTLLEPPRPRQTLIHVHADPDELGRVYEADLPIVSGSPQFAAALRPVDGRRRAAWVEEARADYLANLRHDPLPGDAPAGRGDGAPARAAARRRRDHERRRQLHGLGAPLLRVPPLRHAARARAPARWATASRRRSPRSCSTRSGSSSASPATATS